METAITLQLVHGGFILTVPNKMDKFGLPDDNLSAMSTSYKTEVFTSQGKLMKALRSAIEENSLMDKKTEVKFASEKD
ncbi:hypothetical protein [Acinetobacter sp.]|uniref:hypothetical protein n=1 Tax=Acinetobacter sp. TaxID=472 RepID=UPI00388D36FC